MRFELKTIFGLSQFKTPADKKIKKKNWKQISKKNFLFKQVQRNTKKTYTQIMWYIQNYCLSSNELRNNYFR